MGLREPLTEDCGLPVALGAIGERWSFMILRAALNGIQHFEEFHDVLGISRNVLTNRLMQLVDHGILARTVDGVDRRKVIYELTEKGLDLMPAMIALRQWGERWGSGIPSTPVLVDRRDEQPIRPITIRAADDRELSHQDLCWKDVSDVRAIAVPRGGRDE